jgi:hypothetical protein
MIGAQLPALQPFPIPDGDHAQPISRRKTMVGAIERRMLTGVESIRGWSTAKGDTWEQPIE